MCAAMQAREDLAVVAALAARRRTLAGCGKGGSSQPEPLQSARLGAQARSGRRAGAGERGHRATPPGWAAPTWCSTLRPWRAPSTRG